jgi:O-acetyl-ADP-ribose deacetylase (regulator of RNase III)
VTTQAVLHGRTVRLELGDITTADADAIVNAANEALRGGGGVDGAIHAAAGPGLLEQLVRDHPHGTPTGTAVRTDGGRLGARWVIHAVGPRWAGGGSNEATLLAAAHAASLDRAHEAGARVVAFPAISCGIFGYPLGEAARVALTAIERWLAAHPATPIEEVVFRFRGQEVLDAFARALGEVAASEARA